MSKKVDKSHYKFRKRENETLIKAPGEIDGKDFLITNCHNCEIYLFDYFEQVFVDDSTNCKVFIGPTRGSIFMRECENMYLHSASQQLRISDSKNVVACVYAGSDPALENVTGLKVAPYNFVFPGLPTYFEKAGLNPNSDYWSQVFDFTPGKESRNWELLDPSEYEGQLQKGQEYEGEMVNPVKVNVAYGGDCEEKIIVGSQDPACREDASGMMSFNIQTSQQQAVQAMEQKDDQQEEQNYENDQYQNYDHQQYQDYQNQQQNDDDNWGEPQQSQLSQDQKERQERLDKLRQKEQEIQQKIMERENIENQEKNKRKQAAQEWLVKWETDRQSHIVKQSQLNRESERAQQEQRQKDTQGMQNWKKVSSNIALKVSDYPGQIDVSRMRDSILNKRKDEENLK